MEYKKDHIINIVNTIAQSLEHVFEFEIEEAENYHWFYKMIHVTLKTGQKTEWSIYGNKKTGEFAFEFSTKEKELEQKEKEEIMILYLLMTTTIENYFKKDAEIRMSSLFQKIIFSNDAKEHIKKVLQPEQFAYLLQK